MFEDCAAAPGGTGPRGCADLLLKQVTRQKCKHLITLAPEVSVAANLQGCVKNFDTSIHFYSVRSTRLHTAAYSAPRARTAVRRVPRAFALQSSGLGKIETVDSHKPFFTTVICNYNYGDYVSAAVSSVLEQDYPAHLRDVVVVDDGSTDGSRAALRRFAGRSDVRVIEQSNAGQAAALVRGIELAKGEYVCLLDSDDLFAPDKFARLALYIDALDPAGRDVVVFHDYCIFDMVRGTMLAPSWFGSAGLRASSCDIGVPTDPVFIPIPVGQVYSRALIQRLALGLPTPDHRGGADVALGYGACLAAARIDYLHEVLGTYRVHGANEFAGTSDGSWKPNFTTWHRWPKYLWYLDALMGTFQDSAELRQIRLAFIKRLERDRQGLSSRHRFREPRLDVVITTDDARASAVVGTRAAATAQVRVGVRVAVISSAGSSADGATRAPSTIDDTSLLHRMGDAYAASDGEFVTFMVAGPVGKEAGTWNVITLPLIPIIVKG